MLIYITNPQIAADTGLVLGFNTVDDTLGTTLVEGRNAYDFAHPETFPNIGYVDAEASAYPPVAAPAPAPAAGRMPSRAEPEA